MCYSDCITLGLKSHLLFPSIYRIKFKFFCRIFEAVYGMYTIFLPSPISTIVLQRLVVKWLLWSENQVHLVLPSCVTLGKFLNLSEP